MNYIKNRLTPVMHVIYNIEPQFLYEVTGTKSSSKLLADATHGETERYSRKRHLESRLEVECPVKKISQ